jgi:ABC-2 type transport system permease protein
MSTTQSNAVPDSPAEAQQASASAIVAATRPFYWSVRRELWENRVIYIAPLAVAGLFIFGFLINLARAPHHMHGALQQGEMRPQHFIEQPYNFSALLIMGTTFLIAIFYSIDALHGERRDRSILFWKSLPVSDLVTVLSKASVPIFILPLVTFVITIVTQLIILAVSAIALPSSGFHVSFFHMSVMLLYHLVAIHGLWCAPFYGWFLMVSAWAKRSPFLWAFLVPFAIGITEKITFNTSYFAKTLIERFGGPSGPGSGPRSMSMDSLRPFPFSEFLTSAGFWVGLAITALFLVAAVRLRRYREPI